jgi:hypothetical protein
LQRNTEFCGQIKTVLLVLLLLLLLLLTDSYSSSKVFSTQLSALYLQRWVKSGGGLQRYSFLEWAALGFKKEGTLLVPGRSRGRGKEEEL